MMEEAERDGEKEKKRNQGLTGGQQEQVDNEEDGADHDAAAGHGATQPPDDFSFSLVCVFFVFFLLLQIGNETKTRQQFF